MTKLINALFLIVAVIGFFVAIAAATADAQERMADLESQCATHSASLMDTSNGFICIGKNGERIDLTE